MQQEFLLRINWSYKLRISCNDKITITRDADELNIFSTAALIFDETEGASLLVSNDVGPRRNQKKHFGGCFAVVVLKDALILFRSKGD